MLPFARSRGMLTNVAALCGGGSAPSFSTWNPADKDANIALSNGNLTATSTTGSNTSARGTLSHSSGKYYFEFSSSASHASTLVAIIGIGTATTSLSGSIQADPTGYGWYSFDGTVKNNASTLATYLTWPVSAGQKYGMAVDLTNNKIWFYDPSTSEWNNDVIGNQNPATNTGGLTISAATYFIMMTGNNGAGSFPSDVTINVGASAFANSAPAGFSAWG